MSDVKHPQDSSLVDIFLSGTRSRRSSQRAVFISLKPPGSCFTITYPESSVRGEEARCSEEPGEETVKMIFSPYICLTNCSGEEQLCRETPKRYFYQTHYTPPLPCTGGFETLDPGGLQSSKTLLCLALVCLTSRSETGFKPIFLCKYTHLHRGRAVSF